MGGFLIRRLVGIVPVLLGLSLLAFGLIHLAPGDPAYEVLSAGGIHEPTEAQLEQVREEFGLHRSLPTQYFLWLGDAVRGDFGESYATGRSVSLEMLNRLPATLLLAFCALGLVLTLGIPLALLLARWRDHAGDLVGRMVAILMTSVPGFWLAFILIYVFSERLFWLPTSGWDHWQHVVLPSLVLALGSIGVLARLGRASMLDVINESYVLQARAKGLSSGRVLIAHVLPNGLIPLLTVAGTYGGAILGGSIIIEVIFGIPGIGQLAVESVFNRDLPVLQGYVLYMGLIFVLFNLLVDVAYAMVDPRIRPGERT